LRKTGLADRGDLGGLQGVEPTTYGLAFINCGTAVFDELRRGVQEINFLSDPTVGDLRVGAASPLIDELIPAVVARLADRYPRIEFHVTENDTSTLCRLLHERRLDLAVGRASSSLVSEDVASDALFEDPLLVVAGLNNPWARRRKVDLAELSGEPWIMPEADNLAWVLIEEGFRSAGMAMPRPQIVSNSMSVRTRLVETGRFLTMLPRSTLHFGAGRLRMKVLPLSPPMTARPVEIITLKNRTLNPIAKLFIEEIRHFAKALNKQKSGATPHLGSASS
jgi:DNA-binding transcriptional LysR family regulator